MSLSKSKCWYSKNCSHFLKRTVLLFPGPLSKPKQMFIHNFLRCDKLASMLEFVGGAGFSRSGECYKTYFTFRKNKLEFLLEKARKACHG
jgi:hypothetical protein